jgi:hypothetical protein
VALDDLDHCADLLAHAIAAMRPNTSFIPF